jgi:sugar phosphate isomerase/epimerase
MMTDVVTGIEIACCSFIFGSLDLEASLRLCRDLGFAAVDVSAAEVGKSAHVDQAQAAAQPAATARDLKALAAAYGLRLEELFLCPVFVAGRRVEVSHPDAALRRRLLENFRSLCVFAAATGFRSVMAVPGTPQTGVEDAAARDTAIATLREMAVAAGDTGVRLHVEPHSGSLFQDPADALALAAAVPDLGFTLDYAHFVSRGIRQEEVYPLHARTGHLHARQARPGRGACAVDEGSIDFAAILERLRAESWRGTIALEFFGGIGPKPWAEHAVIQNVALAERLAGWARGRKPA